MFDSIITRFATPAAFAAYLSAFPPPTWSNHRVIGSTVHNTYKPVEADWRGFRSMQGMQADYEQKGWTSGPHAYLACHSPNPQDDGIWMMTPPIRPGTHAGPCNSWRFGLEVVGDFQTRRWSAVQRELLLGTLVVLHRWAKLGADIVGHRDCMAGRTCPDNAAYADLGALRTDLANELAQQRTARVRGAAVYQRRDCTGPVARIVPSGERITIDRDYGDGIVHLADGSGFMRKVETDLL